MRVQEVEALDRLEYLPEGQIVHWAAPPEEELPEAQANVPGEPGLSVKYPAGVLVQAEAPVPAIYVPAGHKVAALAPAAEYLPVGLTVGVLTPVGQKFPAVQAIHLIEALAALEYLPAGHIEHTEAPVPEIKPEIQTEQAPVVAPA